MAKISVLHLGGDKIQISKDFVFTNSKDKIEWEIVSLDPEASSAEIIFFNSAAEYFADGKGSTAKNKNNGFGNNRKVKIKGIVPNLGYTGIQAQKYDIVIYKWALPGNQNSGEVVAAQLDPVVVVEDP